MCCFTQPVERVGKTRIFTRLTGEGSQFIAYQMEYESKTKNAMILLDYVTTLVELASIVVEVPLLL